MANLNRDHRPARPRHERCSWASGRRRGLCWQRACRALCLFGCWTALACADSKQPAAGEGEPLDGGARGKGDAEAAVEAGKAVARADAGPSASRPGDGDTCVRGQYTAQGRPLDMFILLDQSGSMQEDEDRWTPTTNALSTFVALPGMARTSVAMQYFPLGSSDSDKCEADRYAAPDVAMAELPGSAGPVQSSIDAHYFTQDECCDTDEHSGTPTRPAIEGAAAYMRSWLAQHPDHVGVILLATDGEPSDVCDNNDVEDVAAAIAEAAAATPPVKTYVIGIGDNDALDEMATAGSTGEDALIVDGSGANTEQQFLEAISRIREAALPCDYALAAGSDPSSLNVEWNADNGQIIELVNVRSSADCGKAGSEGWYYDDPERPARVNLCPKTCDAIGNAAGATVRIVEGCTTTVLL